MIVLVKADEVYLATNYFDVQGDGTWRDTANFNQPSWSTLGGTLRDLLLEELSQSPEAPHA